jgi:hypothetical protein
MTPMQPYDPPAPTDPGNPGGLPPQEPPGDPRSAELVPPLSARPATGAPVRDQNKGWEVKTPPGWKYGLKDGQLLFGSDTEAGAIFVAYYDGVTFEQAVAALDGEIRKLGAAPMGRPRTATVKAGRALIAEMSGSVNGGAVHGRAIGVAGPSGMLVVLGVSTVDRFATLRQRVDALAQSARFFTPERGQVGLVSGCFRSSSGGSATWVERTLYFDGAGRFSKDAFVAAHSTDTLGNFTGTSSSLQKSGAGGTYVIQGQAIRLTWNDGSTSTYELVNERGTVDALKSGETWYLRCR